MKKCKMCGTPIIIRGGEVGGEGTMWYEPQVITVELIEKLLDEYADSATIRDKCRPSLKKFLRERLG